MKIKSPSGRLLPLGVALVLFCSTATLRAQSPVALQVDIAHPGRAMPSDFCGLSYEIKMVLPNATTGKHYFSPGNEALISTFKTLGVKHLRVGGNTAERATIPVPDTVDIDSLFGFAKASDIKVIYTVRMEGNTPAAAASVAKYVMDHYRNRVSCFTVGNEPDKPWKYPAYLEEWKKFTAVILAPDGVPDAILRAERPATGRGICQTFCRRHGWLGAPGFPDPAFLCARGWQ
jgi:hypothetical protein